ncbi:MAG: protein-glutamate methylesterase/protein-glutamine glutaminase [Gemmatimonadaceae bacterium]
MIRVLVVDDSALVRRILSEELGRQPDIQVVGTATDPYVARDRIVRLRPDVVTLDVEMPRMDGLSFLAKLMKHFPIPVVVVSSLTPRDSENAVRALALGAVEVVAKPGSSLSTPDVAGELARAIRHAASVHVRALGPRVRDGAVRPARTPALAGAGGAGGAGGGVGPRLQTTHKVLAIGASTGGTQAIERVLRSLPADAPGTVIVQHMPEHFTAAFARRLNQLCAMEVREARDQDAVVPGVALIAPGNRHMLLQASGARYLVRVKDGPPVHHQRPAVDVLFQSVARAAGPNAVGVVLTGMGGDGAKGMLAMREAGARTFAQDEESCVVFGMPKEAIRLGAAEEVVALDDVAERMLEALQYH